LNNRQPREVRTAFENQERTLNVRVPDVLEEKDRKECTSTRTSSGRGVVEHRRKKGGLPQQGEVRGRGARKSKGREKSLEGKKKYNDKDSRRGKGKKKMRTVSLPTKRGKRGEVGRPQRDGRRNGKPGIHPRER